MAIPKRPEFFSPLTPDELAILAEWDRMYGNTTTNPTPGTGTNVLGTNRNIRPSGNVVWSVPAGGWIATPIPSGLPPGPSYWDENAGAWRAGIRPPDGGVLPPTTPPPTTTPPSTGGPPIAIDPSFPNVPEPGPGIPLPAGRANPYGAIASLLPGYGLSQQLGVPQHGFGIPGFEDTPTKAGGSWAGTTFMPNQATTLRQNPLLPETDFYAEYRARHGIGSTAKPGTGGTPTGGGTTGGATRLEIGQIDPGTNSKIVGYDGHGNYLVETTSGGDDPRTMVTTGSKYGDIRGDITSAGPGTANPRQNWLGVPITNQGWAINQAVPYQTSWYLSTYGGKPPPYINVHEQIGKSMEGVPPALPTFNWAGPNMMGAAQPYAVGMPPGGWTQMLGFTPGGGK